jgi:hypothetical protein
MTIPLMMICVIHTYPRLEVHAKVGVREEQALGGDGRRHPPIGFCLLRPLRRLNPHGIPERDLSEKSKVRRCEGGCSKQAIDLTASHTS